MTDIQKDSIWKKVFDILKSSLAGAIVIISFKCLALLIHLSVQFSNMQKDINQMQIEIKQLWNKSDKNEEEHKEFATQISNLCVCVSKKSIGK